MFADGAGGERREVGECPSGAQPPLVGHGRLDSFEGIYDITHSIGEGMAGVARIESYGPVVGGIQPEGLLTLRCVSDAVLLETLDPI